MNDYSEFFEQRDEHHIVLHCYGMEHEVAVEDLYQHFKARMMSELGLIEVTNTAEE